ncbi:class I SAM-dependent methyltransferase [Labrenzia sp. OB1]|uniref:class I SAM-dependent methyltransferase n=1 Tax=Labrenzia sp. OB1 TaxID=1561204 RepID=UPI0007B30D7F|nr:class I SAM-dependent methyltransferase [Labrenzia sp. OB1]KZM50579.1 methyltransferase [Labrenzia sp. OB1]
MSGTGTLANFDLREEIRKYWGKRAETFDTQPGHEIFSEKERNAWHGLFQRHLGPGGGRRALDLACGTGVISHLLDELQFTVTGMDWAEPMLERARAKAQARQRPIHFLMGDAERTLEPADSYDVVACRHLVWTLVDPHAAFREWYRVLKPGGRLLVVDGDFVNAGLVSRLMAGLSRILEKLSSPNPVQTAGGSPDMRDMHRSILSRVYFSKGARAEAVADLLAEAGFSNIRIDRNLIAVKKAQARDFPFLKGLERAAQHRYAICAEKPV